MTESTDAAITAEVKQETVQSQAEAETPVAEGGAESPVENNDSLNNVDNASEKTAEQYEEELKKRNAESKRRREQAKELKAENERLAKRLEEMAAKLPTQEQFEDFDSYEAEKQKHLAKIAYAELQKEESDYKLQEYSDPVQEQAAEQLTAANHAYINKLDKYFQEGGTVRQEVFVEKAAVVNEALLARPLHEQAIIVQELASVDTPNAMLNLAENAALRYAIATGSLGEALIAVHKSATKQKTVSKAPDPVPDIEGGSGIPPAGDLSKAKTMSEYRALKARKRGTA